MVPAMGAAAGLLASAVGYVGFYAGLVGVGADALAPQLLTVLLIAAALALAALQMLGRLSSLPLGTAGPLLLGGLGGVLFEVFGLRGPPDLYVLGHLLVAFGLLHGAWVAGRRGGLRVSLAIAAGGAGWVGLVSAADADVASAVLFALAAAGFATAALAQRSPGPADARAPSRA